MFNDDDKTQTCSCKGTVRVIKQTIDDPQGMEPLRYAKCDTCNFKSDMALSAEGALLRYNTLRSLQ